LIYCRHLVEKIDPSITLRATPLYIKYILNATSQKARHVEIEEETWRAMRRGRQVGEPAHRGSEELALTNYGEGGDPERTRVGPTIAPTR